MDQYTAEYDKPDEVSVTLTMSRPTAARLATLAYEQVLLPNMEAGDKPPMPDPAVALDMILVDWAKRIRGIEIASVKRSL